MHRFLILGDDQADPFQSVREFRTNCWGEYRTFATVAELMPSVLPLEWYPDLAIVCQTWSREFSSSDVNRLFAWSPLTRFVVVSGPWCESDGRRDAIWPGGCRVPNWGARTRLGAELAYLRGESPVPPAPTAGRDELFEQHHPGNWLSLSDSTAFFLDIPDPGLRGLWGDLLMQSGAVRASSPEFATLLVADADPWSDSREIELRSMRNQAPEAQLLCMTGLANQSQSNAVIALRGHVVPKLSPVAEQLGQIHQRT